MLLLVLDRRNVVQGAVEPVVVEPVHPGQRCEFEVLDGAPGAVGPDALELVEPDQRLGLRVVIRLADAADRGEGAGVLQPAGAPETEVMLIRFAPLTLAGSGH